MDQDEIKKIYEDLLRSGSYPSDPGHQWAYLQRWLPKEKDSRILDAGCGNGRYALALARQGYSQIDGIDLFDAIETFGAFRYKRGTIDRTEFGNASFDCVFALSVIHYLVDPKDGLMELWRVLKPGGTLVLSAHTRYSLFTLVRLIRVKCGSAEHLTGVRFRSAITYCRLLNEIGFRVMDVDGIRLIPERISGPMRKWYSGEKKARYDRYFEGVRPWMKLIRSTIGYHFITAAQKPLYCGNI
jgi:SAM-dependent methyltransferase